MSKTVILVVLLVAAGGFYFYSSNRFTTIEAAFDFTPENISVTAREQDLHDCRLSLTHDYSVDLPLLRQNQRVTIERFEFKQWNGTTLETMKGLGEEIELKLRCREGRLRENQTNRYLTTAPADTRTRDEEEIDSR